jgi:hypothetical protein
MLKTEISSKIPLLLGLSAPPIKDQVESQGLTLLNHELWERRHTAMNLLNIGGFLTAIEVERIAQRLMTGICQDAYFEEAVREVEAEAAAEAAPAAPAPPLPHQEWSAGELDAYLADEGHLPRQGQ